MKKLKNLPRKQRNFIDSIVSLGGILAVAYFFQDDGLLLTLPFAFFFAWLCPELWSGKL